MSQEAGQDAVRIGRNSTAGNRLTPDEAQRIAGKLGFMATTLFGGMGTAAIQPFYSRVHSLGEQNDNRLTFGLRAAITTHFTSSCKRASLGSSRGSDTTTQAVICSDALSNKGETDESPRGTRTMVSEEDEGEDHWMGVRDQAPARSDLCQRDGSQQLH